MPEASDAISKITAILIPDEAINIDGVSENQQQTIDITQYLPDGIRLADETDALIAVSVEIEKKQGKTVTIPVSRIGVQNVPAGMEVDFGDTSSIELMVMGTSSELAASGYRGDCSDAGCGTHQSGELYRNPERNPSGQWLQPDAGCGNPV